MGLFVIFMLHEIPEVISVSIKHPAFSYLATSDIFAAKKKESEKQQINPEVIKFMHPTINLQEKFQALQTEKTAQ